MFKKLSRIGIALGGAVCGLLAALSFPVLMQQVSEYVPQLANVNPMLIAYTFAQTAPQSIGEMTTEVSGFATTIMPAWLVYVVFALVAAMGIWLIGRAVGSMKRG
jgi:hypothetical protein